MTTKKLPKVVENEKKMEKTWKSYNFVMTLYTLVFNLPSQMIQKAREMQKRRLIQKARTLLIRSAVW